MEDSQILAATQLNPWHEDRIRKAKVVLPVRDGSRFVVVAGVQRHTLYGVRGLSVDWQEPRAYCHHQSLRRALVHKEALLDPKAFVVSLSDFNRLRSDSMEATQ